MVVNLLKMAVGVESVAYLAELQRARLARVRAEGRPAMLRHVTRNTPRRADEVVAGGSIYWVIGGRIRVRQRIVRIEQFRDDHGIPRCALVLDPALVAVDPMPHRPFQGWRYLEGADAPRDLPGADLPVEAGRESAIPPKMAAELRSLGLL